MRCLSYHRSTVATPYRSILLLTIAAALSLSSPSRDLKAQASVTGEIAALSTNALVGGLTSGIGGWLRGEPFLESFGVGALGGSVVYAGKRIVALHTPGAGVAGRLVASVGSSIVLNGAKGDGPLETIVLPVGPVNVYRRQTPESASWSARVNVARTVYLGRLLLRDDRHLDWSATLSAGAPVFVATNAVLESNSGAQSAGFELWATITMSDPDLLPGLEAPRILAHERVHVVQDDFMNLVWANPLERWVMERLPWGESMARYVEPGVAYIGLIAPLVWTLPYHDRFWEVEAGYLDQGW